MNMPSDRDALVAAINRRRVSYGPVWLFDPPTVGKKPWFTAEELREHRIEYGRRVYEPVGKSRCATCHQPGHNRRTCPEALKVSRDPPKSRGMNNAVTKVTFKNGKTAQLVIARTRDGWTAEVGGVVRWSYKQASAVAAVLAAVGAKV